MIGFRPRSPEWRLRRVDDFPARRGSGVRTLCCTTTSCCVTFIGAGVGGLAGLITGIVLGIKKGAKVARPGASRSAVIAFAGFAGFAGTLPLSAFLNFQGSFASIPFFGLLPLVGLAAGVAIAARVPWLGRFLAAMGVFLALCGACLLVGLIVGGAIGFAIDMGMGNFK